MLETVNTTCLDSLGIHIQYRSQKDGNIAWMFERLTASSHVFLRSFWISVNCGKLKKESMSFSGSLRLDQVNSPESNRSIILHHSRVSAKNRSYVLCKNARRKSGHVPPNRVPLTVSPWCQRCPSRCPFPPGGRSSCAPLRRPAVASRRSGRR